MHRKRGTKKAVWAALFREYHYNYASDFIKFPFPCPVSIIQTHQITIKITTTTTIIIINNNNNNNNNNHPLNNFPENQNFTLGPLFYPLYIHRNIKSNPHTLASCKKNAFFFVTGTSSWIGEGENEEKVKNELNWGESREGEPDRDWRADW